MKNIALCLALVVTSVTIRAANAQQISASAGDAPERPTIAASTSMGAGSMSVLQSVLVGIGAVKWHETLQNSATGKTVGSYERLMQITNVDVDAPSCAFSIETLNATDDKQRTERLYMALADISTTDIQSVEEAMKQVVENAGKSNSNFQNLVDIVAPLGHQELTIHRKDQTKLLIWLPDLAAAKSLEGVLLTARDQCVPAPPPPGQGPSLQATLRFIQDKLNSIGPVNYVAYFHDNVAGTDYSNQFRNEFGSFVADPIACRIDFHGKTMRDQQVLGEGNPWFNLKAVTKITVITRDSDLDSRSAADGHPSVTSKVAPPVFLLVIYLQNGAPHQLPFTDEELANRVAKALTHAVELCGGGDKDPF